MDYWALALLLLTLGLGLAVLEVFFPSGGILGFLCIASIVAAVVLGFKSGPGMGIRDSVDRPDSASRRSSLSR